MLELSPGDPIIKTYLKDLQHLKSQQITHELGLKGPFQTLLDRAAKKRGWTLVLELSTHSGGKRVVPDGTVRDEFRHEPPNSHRPLPVFTPNNLILFCLDHMAKQYDEIGFWSELKLSIIRDYATEYSKILSRQSGLRHMYIDGFAGPGVHLSKRTGQFVPGSPLNALEITPPFKEFHFIDADDDRTQQLTALAGGRTDVYAYSGDCNEILPREVFPRASYDRYARALCLLDPYNIDLAWNVVEHAGKMGTIEIFLNFMIMDINMNVLRHDPDSADQGQVQRLNRFWGDNSWRQVAYSTTGNLFGYEEKNPNEDQPRHTASD